MPPTQNPPAWVNIADDLAGTIERMEDPDTLRATLSVVRRRLRDIVAAGGETIPLSCREDIAKLDLEIQLLGVPVAPPRG